VLNFHLIRSKFTSNLFIQDSFWALTGSLLAKGSGLFASIFVARLLGSELFGGYGMIKNIIISTTIFSTFGLAYTSTKFISENIENKSLVLRLVNTILIISGSFSFTIGFFIFFYGEFISINILNSAGLINSVKIASLIIVLTAISSTQTGIIAGLGKFKNLARSNFLIGISTIVFSISLSYFFKLDGAVFGLLVIQFVSILLFGLIISKNLLKEGNEQFSYSTIDFKSLIKISLPVALQEGAYSLLYFLNFWIIIKFSSYSELGIYSASMQWYAIILFIPGILRNVVLSHLSQVSKTKGEKKVVLKKTVIFNFLITLLPAIILTFFSGYIVDFYGVTFLKMKPILIVGLFASIFSSVGNVYSQAFISSGQTWELFFIRLFRDGGTSILAFYLIYISNGQSAAFHLAVSLLLFHFLSSIIMYFRMKFK
jgi:O-antigen/teichoic acid export membrane protein